MVFAEKQKWCRRYIDAVEKERELLGRIKSVELEIRQTHVDAGISGMKIDGMPRARRPQDPMARYIDELGKLQEEKERLQKRLKEQQRQSAAAKYSLTKAFKKLPWKLEQVLLYRYILRRNGRWYTWEMIAEEIDRDISTAKRRHSKAITMLNVKGPKLKAPNPSGNSR